MRVNLLSFQGAFAIHYSKVWSVGRNEKLGNTDEIGALLVYAVYYWICSAERGKRYEWSRWISINSVLGKRINKKYIYANQRILYIINWMYIDKHRHV